MLSVNGQRHTTKNPLGRMVSYNDGPPSPVLARASAMAHATALLMRSRIMLKACQRNMHQIKYIRAISVVFFHGGNSTNCHF